MPIKYHTYFETFIGGDAVFFYLQPQAVVITDINAELITTYRCVRDKVEELISLLKKHKFRHNRDYYSVRANPGSTDIEKAAHLIYLNKICFNGLYRVNSKGQFNVPIGRYENPNICD